MPNLRFDRYYRYDDLTAILRSFAEEFPNLVRMESLGKSFEGRDIYVMKVTDYTTGSDETKPAFWADGNIHATEVSPSSACLHLLHTLTSRFQKDDRVTECLRTRAFYICPRVNPDGAEWALADKPKIIRSSTRPYPFDEEPIGGLKVEDVDGDGRMLSMRIPDPNGSWKISPDEPRLMARRQPDEYGGTYYRILPEGIVEDYDGVTLSIQPKKEQLDLNRNFPANWRPEGEQYGAGPFPTSEPEIRAMVHFIVNHPNITGAVCFHTYSGVLLRPFSHKADEEFPAEDLWTYQKIGDKGTEMTGYPNISVYHDFRYHPKQVITGVFDDWMFEHLGVFAWTVEIWSPQRQAGITEYKYIDWYREHPFEDDLKMLKWSDETLGGRGYIDWYEFDHPQLGKIELGGWDHMVAFRNPPVEFLEKEIAPFSDWLIWHCMISPKLEILETSVERLGELAWKLRATVQNTGWLPTYITKHGLNAKMTRGAMAELELPEGLQLVAGERRTDVGQLEGRAYKPAAPSAWNSDPTDDRAKIEWVVSGHPGPVKLTAKHQRAGQAEHTFDLS